MSSTTEAKEFREEAERYDEIRVDMIKVDSLIALAEKYDEPKKRKALRNLKYALIVQSHTEFHA